MSLPGSDPSPVIFLLPDSVSLTFGASGAVVSMTLPVPLGDSLPDGSVSFAVTLSPGFNSSPAGTSTSHWPS
ncbi:hypothetical protein HUW54_00315 [Staphylococcus aureus]|uniref:hypothetical protein n=1 Tax=Staphylococcus aureus TaxID=1280 RepID=UPI0015876432|nr:hypothetical protein [Staphylococcus aureus]QKV58750.1 hypothetical protein HUW54_00220 [Staphylococcus aureus]QKV58751.1 hypothetical protein HUW54_00290 [Staphylococcus aureus]QKV58752.1 hypothetical protein HUW54_00300 [Staphylococcus aureus]QKV58754.1 hypothetical protein HUW54_00315 [Staphylococcus aureus]